MQKQRRCKRCGHTKALREFRRPFDNAYPCEECERDMKWGYLYSVPLRQSPDFEKYNRIKQVIKEKVQV